MLTPKETTKLVKTVNSLMILLVGVLLVLVGLVFYIAFKPDFSSSDDVELLATDESDAAADETVIPSMDDATDLWSAPSMNTIPLGEKGDLIKYGKELIAHTAEFFGPNGSVKHLSNGLNCQNCHLEAVAKK